MIIKINRPKKVEIIVPQEKRKTVVHVWGAHNFCGIGDAIRGTIRLFQLSKKMDFDLVVDTSLHPISNFLVENKTEYNNFILANKDKIEFVDCKWNCLEKHISNGKDIMYLFTNDVSDENLTSECKTFMKKILTPNDEFQRYINEKISQVPYRDYNILHYRSGDRELVKGRRNKNINIIELGKQAKEMKKYNDVFISDSNILRNYIKQKTDIFMFNMSPAHSGFEKNTEILKNTIFELFLISRAKKIRTYSIYNKSLGWRASGFTLWTSKIHDIPLEII